jgi:hypothetical protein
MSDTIFTPEPEDRAFVIISNNEVKEPSPTVGELLDEETRKKISSATIDQIKERGHPSLGYKHSDESKQKISNAMKNCLPNSGSFQSGQNDVRCKNRLGKTWKVIEGKRIWSDK